jgi:hypothetical protein
MEGSVMLDPHELRIHIAWGDWIRPSHDSSEDVIVFVEADEEVGDEFIIMKQSSI